MRRMENWKDHNGAPGTVMREEESLARKMGDLLTPQPGSCFKHGLFLLIKGTL